MCLRSVSLWAEATWYRLNGVGENRPSRPLEGLPAELPPHPAVADEHVAPAGGVGGVPAEREQVYAHSG
jgi:hypothetical protein